ncbi:hypothetical protein F5Y01DRAFT_299960 [Xylaria sp. FL0043]|nr:hypothetical protein F5Y01DRAFT_299960 [Xylaria sp. FL0043]
MHFAHRHGTFIFRLFVFSPAILSLALYQKQEQETTLVCRLYGWYGSCSWPLLPNTAASSACYLHYDVLWTSHPGLLRPPTDRPLAARLKYMPHGETTHSHSASALRTLSRILNSAVESSRLL